VSSFNRPAAPTQAETRPASERQAPSSSAFILATSGGWAVVSDSIQWVLCKAQKGPPPWRYLAFVRPNKDVLARCLREKGCPPADATVLLTALPDHFGEGAAAPVGAWPSDFDAEGDQPSAEAARRELERHESTTDLSPDDDERASYWRARMNYGYGDL
jgi:hypothetical protein